MVEFTDSEGAFHAEMRKLTTDAHGREVLRGLTVEETEFYVTYLKERGSVARTRSDQARFSELHQKHEKARLETLLAENQLRIESPPRQ